MIEDIDSGINTGMKNNMNKVPKQLPERSRIAAGTSAASLLTASSAKSNKS